MLHCDRFEAKGQGGRDGRSTRAPPFSPPPLGPLGCETRRIPLADPKRSVALHFRGAAEAPTPVQSLSCRALRDGQGRRGLGVRRQAQVRRRGLRGDEPQAGHLPRKDRAAAAGAGPAGRPRAHVRKGRRRVFRARRRRVGRGARGRGGAPAADPPRARPAARTARGGAPRRRAPRRDAAPAAGAIRRPPARPAVPPVRPLARPRPRAAVPRRDRPRLASRSPQRPLLRQAPAQTQGRAPRKARRRQAKGQARAGGAPRRARQAEAAGQGRAVHRVRAGDGGDGQGRVPFGAVRVPRGLQGLETVPVDRGRQRDVRVLLHHRGRRRRPPLQGRARRRPAHGARRQLSHRRLGALRQGRQPPPQQGNHLVLLRPRALRPHQRHHPIPGAGAPRRRAAREVRVAGVRAAGAAQGGREAEGRGQARGGGGVGGDGCGGRGGGVPWGGGGGIRERGGVSCGDGARGRAGWCGLVWCFLGAAIHGEDRIPLGYGALVPCLPWAPFRQVSAVGDSELPDRSSSRTPSRPKRRTMLPVSESRVADVHPPA